VNLRPFSTPDAVRAFDRMQRLLRAMERLKEAQKVGDLDSLSADLNQLRGGVQ